MTNWEELRKTLLQWTALVSANILAFFYDNSYVPAVLGVDFVIIGVEVGIHFGKNKVQSQPQNQA